MQPLISPVDHESRHNSYRADDEERRPTEDTPLLHRFPRTHANEQASRSMAAVVSLLVLTLTSGVVIGVYLLILQNHAENILPPVDQPLQLVSRTQWDPGAAPLLMMSPFRATHVVAVPTDTQLCRGFHDCASLLKDIQAQSLNVSGQECLPYNFLVSSSGQAFEALGWRRASPLIDDDSSGLVLAFIGNFTQKPPTREQLNGAKSLFAESVSLQHLEPTFSVYGKQLPPHLLRSLQSLPQWKSQTSQ